MPILYPKQAAHKICIQSQAGACGCRDMMYLSWLPALQKRSVFWKFEKRSENENCKIQRNTSPHNIVRKLNEKFQEAGACGCRDMMYLNICQEKMSGRKYGRKMSGDTHPRSK